MILRPVSQNFGLALAQMAAPGAFKDQLGRCVLGCLGYFFRQAAGGGGFPASWVFSPSFPPHPLFRIFTKSGAHLGRYKKRGPTDAVIAPAVNQLMQGHLILRTGPVTAVSAPDHHIRLSSPPYGHIPLERVILRVM